MGVIQNITYEDFRQIQRVAGVGSWKYDAINDEIFWSEEVYNIYGIDPQNFQRTFENLLKFIHSGDREKLKNVVEKCLLGNPYQLEYRIKQILAAGNMILFQTEIIGQKKLTKFME